MTIVPPARPQATRETVLAYAEASGPLPAFPFLVGRRGYYGDTMGALGANDAGIYDDALWLVERDAILAFNANCDPSRFAPGIARLEPGRWQYRPGTHGLSRPKPQQYEALVQAGHVTISRGGATRYSGFFGINIHCGGETSTSSLGCQTIPPAQWGDKHRPILPSFMGHVHRALNAEGRGDDALVYVLTSRYA